MNFNFQAIFLAVALIGLGIGLIATLRHFAMSMTANEWGAFLAPTLAYLVFSGYLTEIKAPGFEAKLVARIDAPVPSKLIQASYILGGGAPSVDTATAAFWARAQRVIAIRADTWEAMTEADRLAKGLLVGTSVYQSLLAGSLQGVVVLDDKQKPLGIFEASYFLDVLRVPLERFGVPSGFEKDVLTPAQVRAQFLETKLWDILRFPKQRAETDANKAFVTYDIPRKDALKQMVEKKFEVLVVRDAGDRYMGVLSRTQLVDQLLLDLAEASTLR